MARYRAIARKVIEAEQFDDATRPPIGVRFDVASGCHVVKTMQGVVVPVLIGEWIVKEAWGPGYYPIADDEFRRTYEPAKD